MKQSRWIVAVLVIAFIALVLWVGNADRTTNDFIINLVPIRTLNR